MTALPNGAIAQFPLEFPEAVRPSVEVLRAHAWLGFSLDHDEDFAARAFTARFGAPPQFIAEQWGVLYVGPVPQEASHV